MRQTFIALTIFALAGAVIVAFNSQSDAASNVGILAQSEETPELEPESPGEEFSVSGNLSFNLPEELSERAGDIAACLNESGTVAASFADGVLTLDFSELGRRDLHAIMKSCNFPWPGHGRQGPHRFDGPGFGFREFGFGIPEGLRERFESFPEGFDERFEGFWQDFELPEELQEQLDAVKECFESADSDREALQSCLSELDFEGMWPGRGFGFHHHFDIPEEAPAGDTSA